MTRNQANAVNNYLKLGSTPWFHYPANGCWGVTAGCLSYYFFFEGDEITRVIID